jgi:arsenite/tail-anchored protein-transporting ATPase
MANPLPAWLEDAPPFLFFTGKGGVGKTSLACASAVALADAGRRVLLVGTDPASNLDEVLGMPLAPEPQPVRGVPLLDALSIDPAAAAAAYREKLIGPMRGLLPEAALRSMEEQLSGACTMEIAAFDEFSRILGGEGFGDHDHVVFDTAPTGHTLRLLSLPKAWTGFLAENTSGTSCLGPLAGLEKQRGIYEAALKNLADPARTSLLLVSRAQSAALREARRSSKELSALGIQNQHILLNGLLADAAGDPVARAVVERQHFALAAVEDFLNSLPVHRIPLQPINLVGLDALRQLLSAGSAPIKVVDTPDASPATPPHFRDGRALLEELAGGTRGLVLTMGKGGVGKTTLAAALAVGLARAGHQVLLSTTDPAAHVLEAVGASLPNLEVARIDPRVETEAYVNQVLSEQAAALDADGRALLAEDLRSPCTEEIAVFRAFARTVARAGEKWVVLDTAPTGHTLLLLDASLAYHRELGRQSRSAEALSTEVSQLLPRLRDPHFTRVFLVTLPEPTPVHEAAALQADLRRAGIEPAGWVVNQSLARLDIHHPLLRQRAQREMPCLEEVLSLAPGAAFLLDFQLQEPTGAEALARFLSPNSNPTNL